MRERRAVGFVFAVDGSVVAPTVGLEIAGSLQHESRIFTLPWMGPSAGQMALLGHREPVLSRVRAALSDAPEGYPNLQAVASRLGMSSRTLKRRLHEHGYCFRQLLDEIRCRDGIRLLQGTALSIEDIAYHLGYTAPGNFSRAFRSWMGTTPAAFRKQEATHGAAHNHHASSEVRSRRHGGLARATANGRP